jgi:hypothetical protein
MLSGAGVPLGVEQFRVFRFVKPLGRWSEAFFKREYRVIAQLVSAIRFIKKSRL